MPAVALQLPTDHPGFSDPVYVERRNLIADLSTDLAIGSRPPVVEYTSTENEVWSTVHSALAALHADYAVADYQRAAARLALPTDRVPQLADVSDRLTELSGWRLCAVPGLVSTAEFFGALADRCFPSSQYVRHASVPFYTPEPDVLHELIGHANSLASPRIAGLYERAGQVALGLTDPHLAEWLGRVFWFTLEFGVAMEGGLPRTYGAGLLSSFGEITHFREAEMRPFDPEAMRRFDDYEISTFQEVLFTAASFDDAEAGFLRFLDQLADS
ncbi:MAG: phenylalanine-4-hydroxylase [Ilumatobacteraceae bacterium]|jgi:phenylalanine-4-hydroxylase|nr:phenylalanine-4-hydroxylase [Ilumatobacteraceae bacterium]